jgi:hyperosmotically inducible periplasmic protein
MKSRLLFAMISSAMLLVGCSQSDPGITTAVKTKLAVDDLVKARRIDVTTHDRVVTLSGEVNASDERERAVQIARQTNGVRDVVDQLAVRPEAAATSGTLPPSTPLAGDASITATVKAKLLADRNVGGLKIDVDTTNSVVTLAGTVGSAAEKAQAVKLAKDTAGVTSVNDQLIVQRRR